jgi:cobalt-zinc-cadmium efflux system protein
MIMATPHAHDDAATPVGSSSSRAHGGYMLAEAIGGWLSHSLALIADAGHMLADVRRTRAQPLRRLDLARPADTRRARTDTSARRSSPALANAANADRDFGLGVHRGVSLGCTSRPEVAGRMVMVIATGGLLINLAGMWVLSGGRASNLNIRGSMAPRRHGRTWSIGTIAAGAAVAFLGWMWADPVSVGDHCGAGLLVGVGAARREPRRAHGGDAERHRSSGRCANALGR